MTLYSNMYKKQGPTKYMKGQERTKTDRNRPKRLQKQFKWNLNKGNQIEIEKIKILERDLEGNFMV